MAQAPAQPGQDGQFSDLLATGDQWFQVLGNTLQKGGAPEPIMGAFMQTYEAFQGLLAALQGGGQQAQGAAPMEAGAAQAAPAGNMQMRG